MRRRNKRARTKGASSDSFPGAAIPGVLEGSGTREAIAEEAARLLCEGEETEFAAAKRRAGQSLGVRRGEQPSNLEVHAALVRYLDLFEAEELASRNARLRREALHAMRFFEGFRPLLVGPVLYGTPCHYTPVTLHLFCDEPEAVFRRALDLNVFVDTDERLLRYPDGRAQRRVVYSFARGESEFDLVVLPENEIGHAPISGVDGRPMRRARLQEVMDLVETASRPDASPSSATGA